MRLCECYCGARGGSEAGSDDVGVGQVAVCTHAQHTHTHTHTHMIIREQTRTFTNTSIICTKNAYIHTHTGMFGALSGNIMANITAHRNNSMAAARVLVQAGARTLPCARCAPQELCCLCY
jgi:hypothetical protein